MDGLVNVWFVGWLARRSIIQLVGQLIVYSACSLVRFPSFVECLAGWSVGWLVGCMFQ